ncbi:ABC transporter substrate-binding protein [Rhodococcus artemisiae]|uniref:ABC transporter substrate-binding protein n=1 Tax=Rhodococcus artemisiae TaxID=714159 RepID=A0ABU7L3X7_9NOCA|nr:ABC transporter substrate-binding protein [Rhodococcus artemisiae]MEE2056047.1 ABC transporter substrate-binding protein [Rhodococcus artemisiae]
MSPRACRRTLGLLATATATVLALTSCSTASTTDDEHAQSTASYYPITVTTTTGSTTIHELPERVVTLGNPAFEDVIALGIDPVGASVHNIEALPYLADHADHDSIDDNLADPYANEINFEAILALEPDLIVAPAWPQFTEPTTAETLRKIAPTLIFDMQDADNDWQLGIRQVAQAFDRTDEGEQLIADAVAAYDDVGARHPTLAEKPYSFGLYYNSDIMLASAGNVLRLFGMRPADDQHEVENGDAKTVYSGETTGLVDGALVLLMPSPRTSTTTLESSPSWDGNLSERVVWLSDAQGEAINNAGILGKIWLPQAMDPTFSALD